MSVRLNGKTIQYRAHRFIYECVTGKLIPQDLVINHIDGCKVNNHFDNLEAITPSDNTIHALQNGLMKPCIGELNGCATITASKVRQIIRDIIAGYSNKELASKYNLDLKHVSLLRNKKRWKFIFAEDEFKGYVPFKVCQRKLSKQQREEYILDIASNMSNAAIAIKYNLDASTISKKRSTTIPKGSTLK